MQFARTRSPSTQEDFLKNKYIKHKSKYALVFFLFSTMLWKEEVCFENKVYVMPIIVSDTPPVRGPRDAKRHREKQKELIKKNLPHILVDEDIITGDPKGKKVKVRIRGLEPADFRHGSRGKKGSGGGAVGVGQGGAKKGDVFKKKGQGQRRGKDKGGAGNEGAGTDELEMEVPLEEILDYMFEDVGLPNFKQKESKKERVVVERIYGTTRSGPRSLLKRKLTVEAAFKRRYAIIELLKKETGKNDDVCLAALIDARGDTKEALRLLRDSMYIPISKKDLEYLDFQIDDMRYHAIEEREIPITQAVMFICMDVSGSMTTEKRYRAQSVAFYVAGALRREYEYLDIRFVAHPGVNGIETADLVSEYDAFHRKSDGGTMCFTAFEKVRDLIEHEYPTTEFNVYVLHFSDGDDFDYAMPKTVESVRALLRKGIAMFGYVQIKEEKENLPGLYAQYAKEFPIVAVEKSDVMALVGEQDFPMICAVLSDREHIKTVIEIIFKRNRWGDMQ